MSRNTYSENEHALDEAKSVDIFAGGRHVDEQPLILGPHQLVRPLRDL